MAMRFEQALRDNPAPRSGRDVRLRHGAPSLAGAPRHVSFARRRLPDALFLAAACVGVGVIASLVVAHDGEGWAIGLALLCAGLVSAGVVADRTGQWRRRFVLHFL